MKRHVRIIPILLLSFHLFTGFANPRPQTPETTGEEPGPKSIVRVYYFHTSYRCANCKKFETWSKEVVDQIVAERRYEDALAFDMLNIERNENKHFIGEYRLITKSIILSRIVEGEEVEWKNLDKIWTLLGDETECKEYIRGEIVTLLEKTNP